MPISDEDKAAIEPFHDSLKKLSASEVDQEIEDTLDQLELARLWLAGLLAYRRKLQADSAEVLEK